MSDQLTEKGKPETKNVDQSKTVNFPKMEAKPKKNTEKLKAWYQDEANLWSLATKEGTAFTGIYQYATTTDGKTPDGSWEDLGTTDGFDIPAVKGKVTMLFRTAPLDIDGKITPASPIFKVKAKGSRSG